MVNVLVKSLLNKSHCVNLVTLSLELTLLIQPCSEVTAALPGASFGMSLIWGCDFQDSAMQLLLEKLIHVFSLGNRFHCYIFLDDFLISLCRVRFSFSAPGIYSFCAQYFLFFIFSKYKTAFVVTPEFMVIRNKHTAINTWKILDSDSILVHRLQQSNKGFKGHTFKRFRNHCSYQRFLCHFSVPWALANMCTNLSHSLHFHSGFLSMNHSNPGKTRFPSICTPFQQAHPRVDTTPSL